MASNLLRALNKLGRGVKTLLAVVLTTVLGQLSWRLPGWLVWLMNGTTRVAERSTAWVKRYPVRASAAMLMLLLLVGGASWYVQWWRAQPKPFEASFKVIDPPRTRAEENSPMGKPVVQPLIVRFNASVAPLSAVGKIKNESLDITPSLQGDWTWVTDRELQFKPREDWPIGETYKVSMSRRALAPQARLAEYDFHFKTAAFLVKISQAELYQDPRDPALKKGVFEVEFNFPVDPVAFEKHLALEASWAPAAGLGALLGAGAGTSFTVTYDKPKRRAYIHSAALPLPKERGHLALVVSPGVRPAKGGHDGNATQAKIRRGVDVPGLYSLAVNEVSANVADNEKYEPEQVLTVDFSSDVHEKEVGRAVKVWLLPKQHPQRPASSSDRSSDSEGWDWSNSADVTPEVLKRSTSLDVEAVAAEREWINLHSFKYKADVGRYLYVQVQNTVKSFGGYLLPQTEARVVQVPPYPAQLKILSEGSLLALSGEKKLAVLARDLPGLRIEIGRVLPGQLQHWVSQNSGDFSKPNFSENFGPDNLTERFERKLSLSSEPGKPHYESIDLGEYLKGHVERQGVFLLTVRRYDPKHDTGGVDQEEGDLVEQRLVLVTDLGVVVKKSNDGTQDIFVQSIANGQPVAGATVDMVAKNGLTLASQTTDATGRARFPKMDNLVREKAPLLALVKKDADLSFMPLNRADRDLDYSRFDIGGQYNARSPQQLNAFLFSDRGIYRPGETMRIGMMVKTADWGKQAVGLPLEAEVTDARGLVVRRERLRLPEGGFTELSHATQETSPTGHWAVNLYIVKDGKPQGLIGSTSVRVQEFQPDRTKVQARFSQEGTEGWVKPKDLKGLVSAQNLFGTAAENRRVEASLTLSPAFPAFKAYPAYKFYDPMRAKESFSEALAKLTTNAQGEAEFDLGLSRYAKASYRLHLLAKVFEPEGGRAVSAEASTMVSELPYLLGFKADGDLAYVSRGSQRDVSVIAIDPQAKRTAVEGLRMQHWEVKYVSVLTKQENGTYKYVSKKKEVLLGDVALNLPATGFKLSLKTTTPGTFAYVLRDASGLEFNRIEYNVAGQANVSRSLERNAELQLTLNKKEYEPGQTIEVAITAPYAGAGLITIERDTVVAHQWFKTDTSASVQRIKLPENFEGTGYVSVQFIRDPASEEIFMSPLSYGVVPFTTSLSKRTNRLTLKVPELVKSGKTLNISLTAERPARAVVFAVDEGILQVARYRAPEPLQHFFAKRALEVRTSQTLDLILPEFKKIMAAAAPGGDAESLLGRNLNPFKRRKDKPAVYWSGIVDVRGQHDFNYTVPDSFNGSLKIFAIAVNDDTVGVTQEKTVVRSDFVISPNMPLAVTPGDEFEVSVGVTNSVKGSGKKLPVTLTAQVPPGLELVGSKTASLTIDELREQVAIFRFKAKDVLGSASVTFSAAGAGKVSQLGADLSIRPASTYQTTVQIGTFTDRVDVPMQRKLYPDLRHSSASVAAVPLVLSSGLSRYLTDYPHLCTEQLISRAFADLILQKRPELKTESSRNEGASFAASSEKIIATLRARQSADGGFGLWQAGVQADEFATVHAVHWLLEARERGEAVPQDLLQSSLRWLVRYASSATRDTDLGERGLALLRNRAYATYLLTRQAMVTTPIVARLRETLEARYAKGNLLWQDDLVAAYLAASYQLLKQEKMASDMIARVAKPLGRRAQPQAWAYYYDDTVRDAQTLFILSRHFPQRARALAPDVLLGLTQPWQEGRYNTLSSASLILALDAYVNTLGPVANAKLGMLALDAKGTAKPLVSTPGWVQHATLGTEVAKLRLTNASDLHAYYTVVESGFDRDLPATEIKQGMEILREYVDVQGQPVTRVKVGDEVLVRLRFRATQNKTVSNVALIDLLPGGFEPVIKDVANDVDDDNAEPSNEEKPRQENAQSRPGSAKDWSPDYADIREDRVVIYGHLGSDLNEYIYRIRATNTGTFVIPPAYAESMYERTLRARSMAGKITVEKVAAQP